MVVSPLHLLCFNIRSGRNGDLEAALRVMDQLGVDIGFLLETQFMGGIYTRHLSGYNVFALTMTFKLREDCHLLEGQYFVRGQGDAHLRAQYYFSAFNDGLKLIFCRGVLHPTL